MKPDEVRNAEVGREMMASGNWIVPTFNGLAYLDKPAFFFKCVGLAFASFGVSEGVARLPSVLSGAALLLATFLFGRRVYGRREGLLAAVVVGTVPMFVVFSRLVIMDMMFTLFVCMAILAGFLAEERDGRARVLWHLAGALSAGLATLVKGPLGFVLPWLVLSVVFVVERRPRAILRLLAPWNLVVLFGVVLPWFLILSERHPDFPHYGIVKETFARFTSGEVFRRRKPFYFYGPLILGTFFAWSMLLPEACVLAWRARRRLTRADRLCMIWACLVVVFFSLPHSKQPGYILSVAVPVGLLLARLFGAAMDHGGGQASRAVQRAAGIVVVLCLLAAVGIWTSVLWPVAVGSGVTAVGGRLHLMAPHLPALASACLLCGLLTAWARQRGSSRLIFAAFAAFLPIATVAGAPGLEAYAETRSQRSVADRLTSLSVNTEVVCLQCFPIYLPFYLERQITLVTDDGDEFPSNYIPYALQLPAPWPSHVVPRRELKPWLRARREPVYVIANQHARPILDHMARDAGTQVTDLTHGYVGLLVKPRKGR